MSGTLNKVMLIGHLGDEVKLHYFDDRNCIGRFPLATNETYTSKQTGERVTNTEWHNIVLRNKAAEICEKYLNKGDKVYIEGRLKTRQWQGEDGVMRYSTEVHATDFTFLTNKGENNTAQSGGGSAAVAQTSNPKPEASAPSNTNASPATEEEDDLPF